jgi:anti-sigma factor ChrR (cupin superfamily)
MMSCREVARAVAAGELDALPLRRRALVRLHLLLCRHCRRYAAQIRALGRAARELCGEAPADPAAIERLRAALRKSRADGRPR